MSRVWGQGHQVRVPYVDDDSLSSYSRKRFGTLVETTPSYFNRHHSRHNRARTPKHEPGVDIAPLHEYEILQSGRRLRALHRSMVSKIADIQGFSDELDNVFRAVVKVEGSWLHGRDNE
jgi:hypothetical protein